MKDGFHLTQRLLLSSFCRLRAWGKIQYPMPHSACPIPATSRCFQAWDELKLLKIGGIVCVSWLCLGTLFYSEAKALPGQSTEEVGAWIQAHPTLRPSSGERFLVQKSDTAAQRFTFQASVLPPGRVAFSSDRSIIRNERIAMYDAINGITAERLQESLRVIYGLDIYQDFNRGRVVYEYPTSISNRDLFTKRAAILNTIPHSRGRSLFNSNQKRYNSARYAKTPVREALHGQLRVGDRYAYWIEVAQPKDGKAFTGQMTILLITDLDKLETELRNR